VNLFFLDLTYGSAATRPQPHETVFTDWTEFRWLPKRCLF